MTALLVVYDIRHNLQLLVSGDLMCMCVCVGVLSGRWLKGLQLCAQKIVVYAATVVSS